MLKIMKASYISLAFYFFSPWNLLAHTIWNNDKILNGGHLAVSVKNVKDLKGGLLTLISSAISEFTLINHLFFCSDVEINCAETPLNVYLKVYSDYTFLF